MDAGLDSSKGELESVTSTDSLRILSDEFRLQHLSTPDMTNVELTKKIAALELDNERLRIDLENARIELSAKNAANQGLKGKIAELYVEAQSSLQERQKLRNSVKDAECKSAAAENTAKWYQGQVHEAQANGRTLQVEIDTYQNMLRQKSVTLMNVSAKYKQLNEDYALALQKHKQEKVRLQAEIDSLRAKTNSITNCNPQSQPPLPQSTVPVSAYAELSSRLELAEEELQESRAELRSLEQRLCSAEAEKASSEATCSKQRVQLSATEESLRRYETERNSLAETCRELRIELSRLRSDNESWQLGLLSARQEREQVEQAIEQLRDQLTKMIAQHKLLRTRNGELEEKLGALQDVCDENKRLKALSHSANASLIGRLRQERKRADSLQKQLAQELSRQRILVEKSKTDASLRDSLRQALEKNKELREQLKSSKVSEESVDEGYADGGSSSSVASLSLTNLPSPRPLSPTLLNTISDVLVKSKNFWEPIKLGLDELQSKLDDCQTDMVPNYMPTPPSSPSNDARSVA